LFRPVAKKEAWPPAKLERGQFWLGRFGEGGKGETDEVVLAITQMEPEPRVEIHCHGGAEVVRWLLELISGEGVQVCSWPVLEHRAAADPLQVEALKALVEAPTTRTAGILFDQWQGAYSRALGKLREALHRNDTTEAGRVLEELVRFAPLGRRLTSPWRVAVLGAPNVGKSSLVNALAGFQRAIVSPMPGTTRDVVTTLIAVDGWPVELADTAGLREAAGGIEEQGVERARATGQDADLCLWVMDATGPPVWPDLDLPCLRVVINKIDQPAGWNLDQVSQATRVSALTDEGIANLCRQLANWLVPDPPPLGAAVPFTPELADQVIEASGRRDARRLLSALS
jgi:tRNA modification GTPase